MATGEIQFYTNSKYRQDFNANIRNFLRKESPKTTIIKNGIILPAHKTETNLWADGGVLDEKQNFVKASANNGLFGGKYDFDPKEILTINEEVIYFGPFVKHWGHFICDQITRLWYIKDNPEKYKIAYCGWNWTKNPENFDDNFLELLKLLGCNKKQFINIGQPTRFKKIIIPDLSFSKGNYYTKEFEDMLDIIIKNALKSNLKVPEKIYFSRKNTNAGKERGEEKLEKIFKSNGYKIMYPEELSVKEQITCFNKAKSIAMISGSISHNLLFAKSSNLEAIILNKMSLLNDYQITIDDMTKAKITYIDSYFNLRQVLFGMGPFLLSTTKYLKRFLKDNDLKVTELSHPSISDLSWYFKKYHQIYKIPANKTLLKSQKAALAFNTSQKSDH